MQLFLLRENRPSVWHGAPMQWVRWQASTPCCTMIVSACLAGCDGWGCPAAGQARGRSRRPLRAQRPLASARLLRSPPAARLPAAKS